LRGQQPKYLGTVGNPGKNKKGNNACDDAGRSDFGRELAWPESMPKAGNQGHRGQGLRKEGKTKCWHPEGPKVSEIDRVAHTSLAAQGSTIFVSEKSIKLGERNSGRGTRVLNC